MTKTSQSSFLTEMLEKGLQSSYQPWEHGLLFQPHPNEQALLYEFADCLAVRCFLKMANLQFTLINRANAEHMSPSGEVPFIKEGRFVVAGFDTILDYAAQKGKNLSAFLPEEEVLQMKAEMSFVKKRIRYAEEYIAWFHEPTLKNVTIPRYGSYQAWPLNWLLPMAKRREVKARMKEFHLADATLPEVVEWVGECCAMLSGRLGSKKFLYSDESPTELDAYVFGHLYALLTTELPNLDLAAPIRRFDNLLKYSQRLEKLYFSRH